MRDDLEAFIERGNTTSLKPRRTWMIRIGKTVRFVVIGLIGIVLAYNAPSIGDRPLGSVTLNEILSLVFYIGLALLCVRWMFHSIEDETAEGWANVSAGVAALIVIAAIILWRGQ